MKALLTLGVVLAVILALVGCGGAGTPGADSLVAPEATVSPAGNVTPQANDPALVGTWMMVIQRQDGVGVRPGSGEEWTSDTTRLVDQFRSDGTCVQTHYNAAGTPVGTTRTGTWSTSAGKVTPAWSGDPPYAYPYQVTGNVLTLSWINSGHTITALFAKLVTLTGHDAALVKTWKTTALTLNGVAKPISYLTGTTAYPTFFRQFLAGGTSQRYRVKDTKFLLPMLAAQTWVSGGGVVNYQGGLRQASIYTLAGGVLNIWQLDGSGNTLKITLKPYGLAGGHDARWLGQWHPVSGTLNGVPTALIDLLDWNGDGPRIITSCRMTNFADGTVENRYFNAAKTLVMGSLEKWSTSGSTFTMVSSRGTTTGTMVWNSSTVCTGTMVNGDQTVVVVFNKGP